MKHAREYKKFSWELVGQYKTREEATYQRKKVKELASFRFSRIVRRTDHFGQETFYVYVKD